MAPPLLLIFISSICCWILRAPLAHCANLPCDGRQCRKNSCPSSCSCLGSLVDCSKRGLRYIPKDLPRWLEIIDLQNNNITSVDDEALFGLPNLTELILQRNHLTELPSLTNRNLVTLNLQHNQIASLKNSSLLQSLPNLQVLDLSFNNVALLPANTFGYSAALRYLSFSHNRITAIEKSAFSNLTALESLKLNKNKLSTIPKELFRHLGSLRHLEMNSNNFTQIDGLSFQGLTSLLVLKLRHSNIFQLMDGAFYGLIAIKKLQLDYNNISKVTKGWLYGLNSLQRLYINNNNISEIEDDAWDSGKRLLELDLSHNKLQFITVKTFDKLYSLKRLILSDNLITYIEEGAFRSLSALQYLEMRNNEAAWTIEDSKSVFSGLERLKYLGLANNNIKAVVRQAFIGLPRLERLNLTLNEITTIEENAFDDMPLLQELLINSSSLLCDCGLSWLPTSDFHYPVMAKCAYPKNLVGHSVFQVPLEDFMCNSPKPVLIKQPHTKITLRGENVTLECQAKSSGDAISKNIKFLWRKDGKLLQGMWLWHKSESIEMDNYTLHKSWLSIQNIEDKDEGHYQCIISNHYGSVYSSKARITVHVFPVFTKTPVDVAIKTGSTARLECGAKGQPLPDITWRKDGGEDFPAARERRMHVMLPTDDVFFIVGLKASDTGVYMCTAKNVAGMITANATLTVLETPSFLKKMDDKETRSGETAVLECMASGSPKPKLKWFKDGTPLIPTERHFFTAGNQLLIILRAKMSDSGSYTCEMSNTLGAESGTSHLSVLSAAQNAGNTVDDNNMTGIIVIAVVVCVVGTSIVWVIVIHHTRKTRDDFVAGNANGTTQTSDIAPFSPYKGVCPSELKQSVANIYLDSHSGHSKDSGTGDSAQPSNDDLLIEDDQGLLLEMHQSTPLSAHRMSLLALQENAPHGRVVMEPYASSSSSVSKEHVPLLPSMRTSHSPWKSHRKSIAEFRQHQPNVDSYIAPCSNERRWPCILVQRSLSADQVNSSDMAPHHRGFSEPPTDIIAARVDSDGMERDSGFSNIYTFPRSITQASVSNWSSESPRLHRLPKDTPNDSGSFSLGSEDVHIHSNPVKCVPSVVSIVCPASRTCKPTTAAAAVEQKV